MSLRSIQGESNDVDPKTVNEHKAKIDSFFYKVLHLEQLSKSNKIFATTNVRLRGILLYKNSNFTARTVRYI